MTMILTNNMMIDDAAVTDLITPCVQQIGLDQAARFWPKIVVTKCASRLWQDVTLCGCGWRDERRSTGEGAATAATGAGAVVLRGERQATPGSTTCVLVHWPLSSALLRWPLTSSTINFCSTVARASTICSCSISTYSSSREGIFFFFQQPVALALAWALWGTIENRISTSVP